MPSEPAAALLTGGMDLTQDVLRYRECARHVWNVYFRPMRDGWHEFLPVEKALRSALVLSQFERRPGLWEKHPDGYFDALAVVPIPGPRALPVMFVRPGSGKEENWVDSTIDGASSSSSSSSSTSPTTTPRETCDGCGLVCSGRPSTSSSGQT